MILNIKIDEQDLKELFKRNDDLKIEKDLIYFDEVRDDN